MINKLLNERNKRKKLLRTGPGCTLALNAHLAALHGCLIEPSHLAEAGSRGVGVIKRVTFERGNAVSRGQASVSLKVEVQQAATGLACPRAKADTEVATGALAQPLGAGQLS